MTRRRTWVKVGLLYRREVRHFFLTHGIPFTEDKSWTESLFVYYGTDREIDTLREWINRINAT